MTQVDLWTLENELRTPDTEPLCGVDEAGRGPLAGPVCAAAVMLPPGLEIPGLNDSKKLSEKKREALYDTIIAQALSYGIAFATVEEIEAHNILGATFLAMNRAIGAAGAAIVPHGARILTHCNAGAIATGGYGTALGVVRSAFTQGKVEMVYCDETRPLLQGARLTAWELVKDGIPATLITDNMAASLMAQGKIDLVLLGCDRMAANGDFANKIGTYGVAVLAHYHGIPFYSVLPSSTIDLSIPDGSHIPIEQREASEVTHFAGVRTAPEGVGVYNPAFDVTPHRLLTGIITEKGVIHPPFAEQLAERFG